MMIFSVTNAWAVNFNLLKTKEALEKHKIVLTATFDTDSKCHLVEMECPQSLVLDLSTKGFVGVSYVIYKSGAEDAYVFLHNRTTDAPMSYTKEDKVVRAKLSIKSEHLEDAYLLLSYYRKQTCPQSMYLPLKLFIK